MALSRRDGLGLARVVGAGGRVGLVQQRGAGVNQIHLFVNDLDSLEAGREVGPVFSQAVHDLAEVLGIGYQATSGGQGAERGFDVGHDELQLVHEVFEEDRRALGPQDVDGLLERDGVNQLGSRQHVTQFPGHLVDGLRVLVVGTLEFIAGGLDHRHDADNVLMERTQFLLRHFDVGRLVVQDCQLLGLDRGHGGRQAASRQGNCRGDDADLLLAEKGSSLGRNGRGHCIFLQKQLKNLLAGGKQGLSHTLNHPVIIERLGATLTYITNNVNSLPFVCFRILFL